MTRYETEKRAYDAAIDEELFVEKVSGFFRRHCHSR